MTPQERAREIIYKMVPEKIAWNYHFAFDAVEALVTQALTEKQKEIDRLKEQVKVLKIALKKECYCPPDDIWSCYPCMAIKEADAIRSGEKE